VSKSRGNRTRFRTDEARWINPDLTWVVLRCKPSRDTKAVEYLEKAEHVRRFFASYLFAGLGRDRNGEVAYAPIYDREFLLGALGENGPTEFPASLLQHLADRLSGQDKDETERGKRKEAAAKFEAGEFYRATGGPFNGFLAEVTAILECGTIKADVDIFGRKTPVEFEPRWLGAA
jgi:transcriptional antiterminator NusG